MAKCLLKRRGAVRRATPRSVRIWGNPVSAARSASACAHQEKPPALRHAPRHARAASKLRGVMTSMWVPGRSGGGRDFHNCSGGWRAPPWACFCDGQSPGSWALGAVPPPEFES